MSYAESRVKQSRIRSDITLQDVYSHLNYQLGDEVKATRFYESMSQKLHRAGMTEEANVLLEISKNEETHRSIVSEIMTRIRLKKAGING